MRDEVLREVETGEAWADTVIRKHESDYGFIQRVQQAQSEDEARRVLRDFLVIVRPRKSGARGARRPRHAMRAYPKPRACQDGAWYSVVLMSNLRRCFLRETLGLPLPRAMGNYYTAVWNALHRDRPKARHALMQWLRRIQSRKVREMQAAASRPLTPRVLVELQETLDKLRLHIQEHGELLGDKSFVDCMFPNHERKKLDHLKKAIAEELASDCLEPEERASLEAAQECIKKAEEAVRGNPAAEEALPNILLRILSGEPVELPEAESA
jgi:hypothetical protein